MADPAVGPVAHDEFPAFLDAFARAMGVVVNPDRAAVAHDNFEAGRAMAVRDGDAIVATAGARSFELTVPGGERLPTAGVTLVGVAATHRRRGVLTALMRRQLTDVAGRGEPVAALLASEAGIYGRFGYGPATWLATAEIDRRAARLAGDPAAPGTITLHPIAAALPDIAPAYDAWCAARPGCLSRAPGYWRAMAVDSPADRDGATALVAAVHRPPGGGPADGYALYRHRERWSDHMRAEFTVVVSEVVAADHAVHAALWRHILALDLVATVVHKDAWVDDPLPWLLADRRAYHEKSRHDLLWLRLLDVPRALSARAYAAPGDLVLEVRDAFMPEAGGTFRLTARGGRGTCRRVDAPPDVAVEAHALASSYLGGVPLRTLRAAGAVTEATPGALDVADAMLAWRPAPVCITFF